MQAYRDGGISGLDLELGERPDVIGELDGLVNHVLALQGALGHREHVVLVHLRGNAVWNEWKKKWNVFKGNENA